MSAKTPSLPDMGNLSVWRQTATVAFPARVPSSQCLNCERTRRRRGSPGSEPGRVIPAETERRKQSEGLPLAEGSAF